MAISTTKTTGTCPLMRQLVTLVAWATLSSGALAQNVGTTFTDLWWNPAESGWGVTVDHQQNVMFLTFFIYRADRSPYWVTAVLNRLGSNPINSPPIVFSGDVYETNGPWFGGPFNPNAVTERKVGTATFSGETALATLSYSIDGVYVTKNLQRQTLQNLNFTGTYLGGTVYTTYNCTIPSNNNKTFVESGVLTVSQVGNSFQVVADGQSTDCSFNGPYAQTGSLGLVSNGAYSCTDGTRGTFTMNRIQWTMYGMTAGIFGSNQYCNFSGYLGGITNSHSN